MLVNNVLERRSDEPPGSIFYKLMQIVIKVWLDCIKSMREILKHYAYYWKYIWINYYRQNVRRKNASSTLLLFIYAICNAGADPGRVLRVLEHPLTKISLASGRICPPKPQNISHTTPRPPILLCRTPLKHTQVHPCNGLSFSYWQDVILATIFSNTFPVVFCIVTIL